MIGQILENLGWRQGSIVKDEDSKIILTENGLEHESGMALIVASQSCDIACNDLSLDPYVELSIVRTINAADGNFISNRNPRRLHSKIISYEQNEIYIEKYIDCKAYEKITIRKDFLRNFEPDLSRDFGTDERKEYVHWLSARYKRPALPTEFNKRISKGDPKNKRKKLAKKLNSAISGLYVKIIPNKELPSNESYNVLLLGLIQRKFNGDLDKVSQNLQEFSKTLESQTVNITCKAVKETNVSVGDIRDFDRFNYDSLSIEEDLSLPFDI